MGVLMTASESNHQRVLDLIFAEDEQMLAYAITEDKKSPAVMRGESWMPETTPPWISGPNDMIPPSDL